MDLPFALESDLERRIAADPEWQEGAAWGEPRRGHPEGAVVAHVADVLRAIDEQGATGDRRRDLRLVALVHDTMKKQCSGPRRALRGHHGVCARRFAERHLDDPDLLDVIEWHDDAYRAWKRGARRGRWDEAERRGHELIDRLGDRLGLYLDFYRADNATGDKSDEPLRWFEGLARARDAA